MRAWVRVTEKTKAKTIRTMDTRMIMVTAKVMIAKSRFAARAVLVGLGCHRFRRLDQRGEALVLRR